MRHEDTPKSQDEMRSKGLLPMSGAQFLEHVCGKCFSGLYRAPFSYVMHFGDDQTQWGQNNFGTRDEGCWKIDPELGTMTISWKNYWDANTTHGFIDGAATHLFDAKSGIWRTTLIKEISESELASFN